MKLGEIVLTDVQTLGANKAILTDVKPVYNYVNGERTDVVIATAYIVACPKKAYEKVTVKVPGTKAVLSTEEVAMCDEAIWVSFEGFEGKFYTDSLTKEVKVSAKAQKVNIVD